MKMKKIRSIFILLLTMLILVSCSGTGDVIDNRNDDDAAPAGANKSFEPLEESGRFSSDTGTNLNLFVDWSLSSQNGRTGKLQLNIGISCNGITVSERKNQGTIKIGEKISKFSSPAINDTDTTSQTHDFCTKEFTVKANAEGTFNEEISVMWAFNGTYGDKEIKNIVASATITATAKRVSGENDDTDNSSGTDSGKMKVAFTFDDGPHSERTVKIVDELKKYNAHATFFIVGNRLSDNASAMKYAYQNGNEIGIHGYTHGKYYDTCDDDIYNREINNTLEAIHTYIPDAQIRLMRPVGGRITQERLESSEYSIIMWSVDSEDWRYKSIGENKQENIDTIVNNVMNNISDGDIVLMHDIYENTYEAFCIIIEKLYEQGYEVVSVSELIGSSNLKAGTKYSRRPAN